MKICPTCGTTAEERASFCPCCGTSFVVSQPTPPQPPIEATKPTTKPAPQPTFGPKKKRNEHALPITIIAVLTTVTVALASLWLSGGLAAMLGRDTKTTDKKAEQNGQNNVLESIPTIAATYGDGQEITTQQYLAYLYLEFENVYYNQGLYQYEAYGMDPWEQTFPYGENDEQLLLSDYIIRATQDNIKRQIVLAKMMQDYGIDWMAEEEAELDKDLAAIAQDAYIHLGIDNDSYAYALKNLNLNERSTFYGLYGKGGMRAVSELEIRQYFVQNYLSYHMICIPLTDQDGNALNKNSAAYQEIVAKMSGYLSMCQTSGFNTVYVTHTGHSAENARTDIDATQLEAAVAQAVRTVNVGDTSIVEFVSGTTPYIALIQRLDIYDPPELFENAVENILYTLKYTAFDNEVKQAIKQLAITFDETVIAKYRPEEFLVILENT